MRRIAGTSRPAGRDCHLAPKWIRKGRAQSALTDGFVMETSVDRRTEMPRRSNSEWIIQALAADTVPLKHFAGPRYSCTSRGNAVRRAPTATAARPLPDSASVRPADR